MYTDLLVYFLSVSLLECKHFEGHLCHVHICPHCENNAVPVGCCCHSENNAWHIRDTQKYLLEEWVLFIKYLVGRYSWLCTHWLTSTSCPCVSRHHWHPFPCDVVRAQRGYVCDVPRMTHLQNDVSSWDLTFSPFGVSWQMNDVLGQKSP